MPETTQCKGGTTHVSLSPPLNKAVVSQSPRETSILSISAALQRIAAKSLTPVVKSCQTAFTRRDSRVRGAHSQWLRQMVSALQPLRWAPVHAAEDVSDAYDFDRLACHLAAGRGADVAIQPRLGLLPQRHSGVAACRYHRVSAHGSALTRPNDVSWDEHPRNGGCRCVRAPPVGLALMGSRRTRTYRRSPRSSAMRSCNARRRTARVARSRALPEAVASRSCTRC
jgi:hypothetical protein